MKMLMIGITVLTFSTLTGCAQGTPGGPGTTERVPLYGQADNTFNLVVPGIQSSLQPGAESKSTVGIKRSKNFGQDVSIEFSGIPKGVTLQPTNPTIKHGDANTQFTVQAGDDAIPGDFEIKVVGHPTVGANAQSSFKLTIEPKDSFELKFPKLSTLTQGTTQPVVVEMIRDESFDQDVTLKFGDLPVGVTLGPSAPVIKHNDENAQIALTGAKDASLGDFAIEVTAHPTEGADVKSELLIRVIKE